MSQSQQVSQLSLIKITSSTSSKCTVFCEVDATLDRYELPLDDATTVDSIISDTIRLVKKTHSTLSLQSDPSLCELYASKKSGRKVSDLPSLERQQQVVNTGIKCFYLTNVDTTERKRGKITSVSTKSIQSEMNTMKLPKGKEVKASKVIGCFCFSWLFFSLSFIFLIEQ